MAGGSDIRVKLSAEGVEDVVRALKRVEKQAKDTGASGKKGIGLMNEALGDMGGMLPTLGVGAFVAGLGALVSKALETADAIGKLSDKTGVSAETISVLTVAGKTADATFEQISGGLIKFNKNMADLDRGSSEAAQSVRLLFGNSKALNGLNTEQRLLKVVDAVGSLEKGYKKTRTAQDFFGKSGADLITTFNDLAKGGFDEIKKYAEQTGQLVGSDFADAAQRANDGIRRLKDSSAGLAAQFAAGLAPAIADITDALLGATTGGQQELNLFRELGDLAGKLLKGVASAFIIVGKTIGGVLAQGELEITSFIDQIKALYQFIVEIPKGIGKAKANLDLRMGKINQDYGTQSKAIDDTYKQDLYNSLNDIWNPTAKPRKKTQEEIADEKAQADAIKARAMRLNAALIAAENQRTQAMLQIQKAANSLALLENENCYKNGQIDLETYWNKREKITLQGVDDELAALRAQKESLQKTKLDPEDPTAKIKLNSDIAEIENKINVTLIERQRIQKDLAQGRMEARNKLKDEELKIEQQILEMQGKTYEAQLAAIQAQADAWRKAKIDPSLVKQIEDLMNDQAAFQESQRKADSAMGQVQKIQDQVALEEMAGKLYPFEAAEKYRLSVEALIPSLLEQADAMRKSAVTQEEIDKAEAFRMEIDKLAVSVNKNAQEMKQFKAQLESSLESNLTDFFANGIEESENFGDAMRKLGQSVVASLKQMAAQMLATYLTQKILSAIGMGNEPDPGKAAAAGAAQAAPLMMAANSMSGAGDSLIAGAGAVIFAANQLSQAADKMIAAGITSSASSMGSGLAAATGGLVQGPGTGTSDSIPARLSDGEFIVRSAVVSQPGVLQALASLNRGLGRPVLAGTRMAPRFSDGGLVRTADGGQEAGIVVGLEEGVIVKQVLGALKTKEAQRIQIQNLGNNQKRARNALGR